MVKIKFKGSVTFTDGDGDDSDPEEVPGKINPFLKWKGFVKFFCRFVLVYLLQLICFNGDLELDPNEVLAILELLITATR
ncbi:hypothetical protein N6H18_13030 [Reichenbachiella agarivorans]|uniref:Uncharacterized protein n=1 Tax=Reichenbachiella agarivorans TaxID=2979464 RepID=A0ABY6CPI3_9BACT|nr:hypothetical protein [Reichenbachiella agarivorans]UXP31273.1 hypothetical protein N6H18_13030 [Reichenbachiella agarivorans]